MSSTDRITRRRAAVLVLGAAALALAACGRRGDPEFVSEAEAAKRAAHPDDTTPTLRRPKAPGKPKDSFILDPLL